MSFTQVARRFGASAVAIVLVLSAVLAFAPATQAAVPAALPLAGTFDGYTDKAPLTAGGRAIVADGVLPVVDGTAPAGTGTSYYIDSTAGDDAAAGSSEATAWKTFVNVNSTTFLPGDRILLRAGSSWAAEGDDVAREAYDYTSWSGGQPTDVIGSDATAFLAPKGSGTADSPVVLSSYGSGAAPEINGRGVVNDVLQLTNQQYWDISNLEISNVTDGFDPTTFVAGANDGLLPGEENPKTGDLRGIHVQGENAGTLRGYDIHNVFVHDVSGVIWSIGNTGLDRSKRTGGILFEGLKGDGQTVSQFDDITLEANFVANTSFANIAFKQFSGMGENRYKDVEPGWGDRAVGKAAPDGTITEDPDWRPNTNVHVAGNYLTNRDTAYGWDSLYLTSVQGATVAGNVIDGTGVSGIEMYYSDNIVVQDNEVAEVEMRANASDSNGIDPDRGTSNVLIQGNYIHDSGEGVLLCGFAFGTAIVRYNVIQDVEKNYINPHGDSGVNVIYNNLLYNTQIPTGNTAIGFFDSSGSAGTYLVAKNPHYLMNNVFVNTRSDVSGAEFRSDYPGVHFDSNSYVGPKVAAPSTDAKAVTSEPHLGGNPADDIRNVAPVESDSSLIAAGRPVDLSQIVPGFAVTGASEPSQLPLSVDFFGANVGSPPNVGPASYVPPAGSGLATGTVVDEQGESVPGATVTYSGGTVIAAASGRYALEAPVGQYDVVPSAPGYADGAPVTVNLADGEVVDQDLPLGETTATTGTLAGTVTAAGKGVADATVTVSVGGSVEGSTTTDAAGEFVLADLGAGTGYSLSVVKVGYEEATQTDIQIKAARTVTFDLVLAIVHGETSYAINETFDTESTGTFTATADGALVATSTGGSITIEDDATRTGNKYLKLSKPTASAATLAVSNAVEQNLTGTVTIEARLKRTTTNGSPNQFALYSYTESGWNAATPTASTNPAATLGFSNGKIITHNVTGASTVKNVADYTVGQWTTVRNVVDLTQGTFDFYLDDMTTPVLADQPLRTMVDDLDYFTFFTNGSNVGDLLVDYFRVNTGTPYDYGDASLGSVTATSGGEEIALVPSSDGVTFSGTVTPFTDTITLGAASGSQFAKVAVGGAVIEPGTTVDVPLTEGGQDDSTFVTDIPVVVTAEDGTEQAYSVSISRTNPNQTTALRALTVHGYDLSPAFDPDRQGEDQPYVVTEDLPSTVASVDVGWELGWTGQLVQVNGDVVPAGATQVNVPLHDGTNVIEVTANSYAGDFGAYAITLTRATAEPAFDVDVVTTTKCVAGKVILTVAATNSSGLPLSVTLSTDYGSKIFATIDPGKTSLQAFTTRLASLPTGSVAVDATGTIDGTAVTQSTSASYPTRTC